METLVRQDRVLDGTVDLADILDTPWEIFATHKATESMANRNIKYLEKSLA